MRKDLFANAKKHLYEKTGRILFTYSEKAQKRNPLEEFCNGYSITKIDESVTRKDTYYLLLIKPEKV